MGSTGRRVCAQRHAQGGAEDVWTATRCLLYCSTLCYSRLLGSSRFGSACTKSKSQKPWCPDRLITAWSHSSDQTVAADETRDAWLEARAISVDLNPGAAMLRCEAIPINTHQYQQQDNHHTSVATDVFLLQPRSTVLLVQGMFCFSMRFCGILQDQMRLTSRGECCTRSTGTPGKNSLTKQL